MLKSPEEYLSSLEFDATPPPEADRRLNAEERAFVEKYMGLGALDDLPEANPEPVALLQSQPEPASARPVIVADREIVIAPAREEDQELRPPMPAVNLPVLIEDTPPQILVVESPASMPAEPEPAAEMPESEPTRDATSELAPSVEPARPEEDAETARIIASQSVEHPPPVTAAPVETASPVIAEAPPVEREAGASVATLQQASPESVLKEKLKLENEVQMVSFYVGGQIFLLPVAGIQEVLRHMELIKVPQAPWFVAGVINLRGRVTPVVHLSALVTNAELKPYDESNFIIITGSEKLQLGLIIDKVSSMHMVPQNKIIWNAESKLAEAAEFLSAIVDLDDRVCGVVSPEMITRLILPEA